MKMNKRHDNNSWPSYLCDARSYIAPQIVILKYANPIQAKLQAQFPIHNIKAMIITQCDNDVIMM